MYHLNAHHHNTSTYHQQWNHYSERFQTYTHNPKCHHHHQYQQYHHNQHHNHTHTTQPYLSSPNTTFALRQSHTMPIQHRHIMACGGYRPVYYTMPSHAPCHHYFYHDYSDNNYDHHYTITTTLHRWISQCTMGKAQST